jgi:hypothetical protein
MGLEIGRDFVRGEHRYELLTSSEIDEAVAQEKVVVLPIGSVEQNGHDLPRRDGHAEPPSFELPFGF